MFGFVIFIRLKGVRGCVDRPPPQAQPHPECTAMQRRERPGGMPAAPGNGPVFVSVRGAVKRQQSGCCSFMCVCGGVRCNFSSPLALRTSTCCRSSPGGGAGDPDHAAQGGKDDELPALRHALLRVLARKTARRRGVFGGFVIVFIWFLGGFGKEKRKGGAARGCSLAGFVVERTPAGAAREGRLMGPLLGWNAET